MRKEKRMLRAHLLKDNGYTQKEIALMLGVSDRTVRNYLKRTPSKRKKRIYSSKLDPFKQLVKSIIKEKPFFNCVILFERLQALGYKGGISILRDYAAIIRKEALTEAVIRFETEPGYQAQVDWKDSGYQIIDGVRKKLYAFAMKMGFSRKPFFWFTTSMRQSVLHAAHVMAFRYFNGVPKEILYDNMKTAFVVNSEGDFVPNRKLLTLAHHYGFFPKRCQIRRPQTKGKVERAIEYLIQNFWPRVDKSNLSLDDLNEKVQDWLKYIDEKEIRDLGESRKERFEKEKPYLKPLPVFEYDYREVHELDVSKESFITFKTNRYSVPPEYIGKSLTLKAGPMNLEAELLDGSDFLRVFKLEKEGLRKKVWLFDDKAKVSKMWEKQFNKRLKKEKDDFHIIEGKIKEVVVRHPSFYEKIFQEAVS